nr:Actin rearrangement inducing factor 1 [Hyphantria cunea nucleopolyhedrovirus]UIX56404.1 Actin rearrangement inducing factor 1 [Hyphantria cunea nucleopolyhedrovirus]
MLEKINYILQLLVHFELYAVSLVAFVFSLMGTVNEKYAFLLELENSTHSVINVSFLAVFLLGPCVFVTTTWGVHKIILCYHKQTEVCHNYYIKTIITMAHLLAISYWTLFVVFQPQIYNNGHVPLLDAYARDYDQQSLCWNNVVLKRYDVHDFNAILVHNINPIFVGTNCVYLNDYMKKCVGCRLELRHNEPTIFNQNQVALMMIAILLIVLHWWNMYILRKEMRKRPVAAPSESAELEYDTDKEEERFQNNMRMLEIISENRRQVNFEFVPLTSFSQTDEVECPLVRLPELSPSSPDSGIGEPHYAVPKPIKPIYSVPARIKIKPVPPPRIPVPQHRKPFLAKKHIYVNVDTVV